MIDGTVNNPSDINVVLAKRFSEMGIPPSIMFQFAETGRLDQFLKEGWVLVLIKMGDGNFAAMISDPSQPLKIPDLD